MQLRIRTYQADKDKRAEFRVLVGQLTLEGDNSACLARYGAPALDRVFPRGEFAKLRAHGEITTSFATVDEALEWVQEIKDAIDDTHAYWRRAGTFTNEEVYPPSGG